MFFLNLNIPARRNIPAQTMQRSARLGKIHSENELILAFYVVIFLLLGNKWDERSLQNMKADYINLLSTDVYVNLFSNIRDLSGFYFVAFEPYLLDTDISQKYK